MVFVFGGYWTVFVHKSGKRRKTKRDGSKMTVNTISHIFISTSIIIEYSQQRHYQQSRYDLECVPVSYSLPFAFFKELKETILLRSGNLAFIGGIMALPFQVTVNRRGTTRDSGRVLHGETWYFPL
uniref:Uncharacterized protein n=1 Tax=Glossina palpalis gambiensis TaxID=67801 RepID=A0A1B0BNR0_9MUSC